MTTGSMRLELASETDILGSIVTSLATDRRTKLNSKTSLSTRPVTGHLTSPSSTSSVEIHLVLFPSKPLDS